MSIPGQRVSPEASPAWEALHRIWDRLDPATQQYISLYHARLRKANKEATDAWNKRQSRGQYLQDYCDQNGYSEFNKREKIIKDWAYNDANDDMIRWTREAERCWAAIQAELNMAIMRGV